ncbi:hypothetical protein WR25_26694 [Diploscapter pachys]|uniref:Uncharacterized protein n=1 Tax=Diploscapter pachys TaxID=2018661 RepID=A0A2A2L954_9BILA|nr:hypothetical protein WR25_26694 [Diploscapter pachys]
MSNNYREASIGGTIKAVTISSQIDYYPLYFPLTSDDISNYFEQTAIDCNQDANYPYNYTNNEAEQAQPHMNELNSSLCQLNWLIAKGGAQPVS